MPSDREAAAPVAGGRSEGDGRPKISPGRSYGFGFQQADRSGTSSAGPGVMFCDRRQVTSPLGASVSTSVKEGGM